MTSIAPIIRLALTLTVAAAPVAMAHADRVILRNGGQIEGRLVEDEAAGGSDYIVETTYGGRITLARSAVERIEHQSDLQREHQQRARAAPDTVEAQWELATWCRDQKLMSEFEQHLQRIVELDPQHAEARNLLGYRAVDGRWLTRDELMASRGLLLHRGKYRSQQEIELLERHEESQATAGQWRARIARWRRQLFDRNPDRVREAHDSLLAIRDPAAVDTLVSLLAKEDVYEVKLLLLEILSQIEDHKALDVLVDRALFDENDEIRAQSLDHLINSGRPKVASPFIRALKHRENVIVNRAAHSLQEIGDPVAIKPLIEALFTQHRIVGGGPDGQQSYGMDGSGVFSFGGGGPKVENRRLKNPAALSALVALSGGRSFDYDQPRWRAWLAAQKQVPQVDMRRDE